MDRAHRRRGRAADSDKTNPAMANVPGLWYVRYAAMALFVVAVVWLAFGFGLGGFFVASPFMVGSHHLCSPLVLWSCWVYAQMLLIQFLRVPLFSG